MTNKMMLIPAALLAAAIAGTAIASSYAIPDDLKARVTEKLTQEGYEVRKIDREDGQIEVYALKDGAKVELYLDADLNVTRQKIDD